MAEAAIELGDAQPAREACFEGDDVRRSAADELSRPTP
jgi:hypothetical protein